MLVIGLYDPMEKISYEFREEYNNYYSKIESSSVHYFKEEHNFDDYDLLIAIGKIDDTTILGNPNVKIQIIERKEDRNEYFDSSIVVEDSNSYYQPIEQILSSLLISGLLKFSIYDVKRYFKDEYSGLMYSKYFSLENLKLSEIKLPQNIDMAFVLFLVGNKSNNMVDIMKSSKEYFDNNISSLFFHFIGVDMDCDLYDMKVIYQYKEDKES